MGKLTSFADDAYPDTVDVSALPSANFSLQVAHAMAWASQLAYETEATAVFDRLTTAWGWGRITPIQLNTELNGRSRHARGYVAHLPDALIIAFCGTEPDRLSDVLIDLDLLPRGGNVSHGMADALGAVWPAVLGQIGTDGKPIYLTGHSLGGAFAVLAAQRLMEEPPSGAGPVHGVYTFGMPRVGDAVFAEKYNAALGMRTYRLVHGDDLVANVPPAAPWPFDFRHVGRPLHCGHHATFAGLPAPLRDETPLGPLEAISDTLKRMFNGWQATIGKVTGLTMDDLLPDELCPPNQQRPPFAFPARYRIAEKLVPVLPQQARDHVLDDYLRALGHKFRGG